MLTSRTKIGGRYQLVLPLGEREDVSVWQANDTKEDMSVALAIVKSDSGSVRKKRFLEVVKSLEGLDHPNIVKALASGETDDGDVYYVMEMLEGDTLAVRLEEEPALWLSELLDIAAESLEGLSVLHDRGIVHGDIEPGNIVLVTGEGRLVPKLIGLGYSRTIERLNEAFVDPNDEGYLHSLTYASPEQAVGETNISSKSDLYSLGVVLYEALSGRHTAVADTSIELRRAIVAADPTPLDTIDEFFPAQLSRVVQKALASSADDRFEDARAMQRELLAVVLKLPSAKQQAPLPMVFGEDQEPDVTVSPSPEVSEPSEKDVDTDDGADQDESTTDKDESTPDEPDEEGYFRASTGDDDDDEGDVESLLDEIAHGESSKKVKQSKEKRADEDSEAGPLASWIAEGCPAPGDGEVRAEEHADDGREQSLDLLVDNTLPGVMILQTPTEPPRNWRWVIAGFAGFAVIGGIIVALVILSGPGRQGQVIVSAASDPTAGAAAVLDPAHPVKAAEPSKGGPPSLTGFIRPGAGDAGAATDGRTRLHVDSVQLGSKSNSSFAKVDLLGLPDASTIRLDGALVEDAELRVPIDGREHILVIWAAGYKRWTKRLSPTADTDIRVILTPADAAPTKQAPSSKQGRESNLLKTLRQGRSTKRRRSPEQKKAGKAIVRDPGF